MEKEIIILVGPSGSGKTTYCESLVNDSTIRISQDDQGKDGHWKLFIDSLNEPAVSRIVIDRCNFSRHQRSRFLNEAKERSWVTTIVDITQKPKTCFDRIMNREGHPTLGPDKDNVLKVLYHQFKDYEKPTDSEADNVNDLTDFDPYCLDLTEKLKGKEYLVIGDIHGCYDELIKMTIDVGSMPFISVGDLIDRGPKVLEVVKFFMTRNETYSCMGNHENKLLRCLIGNNVRVGKELSGTLEQLKDIDKHELALFIMSMPLMIKVGPNYIFHAGINPTWDMMRQGREWFLYTRKYNPENHSFEDLPGSKYWHESLNESHKYTRRFFGHHYHENVNVAHNTYALDGHCVYGKELRGMLMPQCKLLTVPAYDTYAERWEADTGVHEGLNAFEAERGKGYVRKVMKDNMVLYVYTERCNFDRAWNETTRQARGIIFNADTGDVLARPFKKFFNLNEVPETRLENLPDEPYECFDKMDGSLGIIFHNGDKWTVATKGSFESDQALKAQEMLESYGISEVNTDWTLLVEIIYPENRFTSGARLVCDYGEEQGLFLLAVMDRESQIEMPWWQVLNLSQIIGMPRTKKYTHTIDEMIELQKTLPAEREGFVVKFESGLRVKIKGEEYLKIHRALNNISPLFFWENMNEGKVDKTIIEAVPEEFRDEAEALAEKLENRYKSIHTKILIELDYMHQCGVPRWQAKDPDFRKQVGLYLSRYKPIYQAAFFSIIDDKKEALDRYILRTLRPKGNVLHD